ncbi:MAG TPA: hypothetical protein VIT62_13510 [Lysobacter sp.]
MNPINANHDDTMVELSHQEIEQVSGGFAFTALIAIGIYGTIAMISNQVQYSTRTGAYSHLPR